MYGLPSLISYFHTINRMRLYLHRNKTCAEVQKIPISKYACVSVDILKGHGQLLDQLHDHLRCMLLDSNVLEMALTDIKVL